MRGGVQLLSHLLGEVKLAAVFNEREIEVH